MRRLAGPLVVLAAAVVPAPAAAHGGDVLAATQAGPFQVTVTAAPLLVPGRSPAIDYTAYVSEAGTGRPVTGATVRFMVGPWAGAGVRRPAVQEIGGGYEAVAAIDEARTRFRDVPLVVTVAAAGGSGRIAIDPQPADASGPPGWLFPVTGVLAVGLGAVVLRRRRTAPD